MPNVRRGTGRTGWTVIILCLKILTLHSHGDRLGHHVLGYDQRFRTTTVCSACTELIPNPATLTIHLQFRACATAVGCLIHLPMIVFDRTGWYDRVLEGIVVTPLTLSLLQAHNHLLCVIFIFFQCRETLQTQPSELWIPGRSVARSFSIDVYIFTRAQIGDFNHSAWFPVHNDSLPT